jgi:hypothetical protein
LLQLISDHGSTISTGFFQNSSNTESLSKCLRYLRNVLGLEASVATLDASSSSYQILGDMALSRNNISFRGQIYIPVKWEDNSIWGFIKIENILSKPTSAQLKKAVQAVQDLLGKDLNPAEDSEWIEDQSLLIVESSIENSHRISTTLFQDKKFTAFINISEWIIQEQPFTLRSLREFSDSLLYVPEIMDLNTSQRSVLALYSLLPDGLKKSSLVIATKLSVEELEISLLGEPNFLKAFANRTTNSGVPTGDTILGI